jgi:hypothetical protein
MSKENPLQPFTGAVRFLWSVTTVGFLLSAVLKVYNLISETRLCFTSAVFASRFRAEYLGEGGLRDGTYGHPTEMRFCLINPTAGDRALGVLDRIPSCFAYAVVFFLLLRLLERAAAEGVHTIGTADRVRRFGWFTLVALPAVTMIEALVRTLLLKHAVTFEVSVLEFTRDWSVPWWAVVTGLGMLSLAKIMRSSTDMRLDLEGTV